VHCFSYKVEDESGVELIGFLNALSGEDAVNILHSLNYKVLNVVRLDSDDIDRTAEDRRSSKTDYEEIIGAPGEKDEPAPASLNDLIQFVEEMLEKGPVGPETPAEETSLESKEPPAIPAPPTAPVAPIRFVPSYAHIIVFIITIICLVTIQKGCTTLPKPPSPPQDFSRIDFVISGRIIIPDSSSYLGTKLVFNFPEVPYDRTLAPSELNLNKDGDFEAHFTFCARKTPHFFNLAARRRGYEDYRLQEVPLSRESVTTLPGTVILRRSSQGTAF
jgi:hypothetical protein